MNRRDLRHRPFNLGYVKIEQHRGNPGERNHHCFGESGPRSKSSGGRKRDAAPPLDERAEPAIIATEEFRSGCYTATSSRSTNVLFDEWWFDASLRRKLPRLHL
jgi:hypothetical protein